MSLPKGFLIGAATAAHQVEGNNVNSDDWAMEQMKNSMFLEPSGDACDHYHRYEEDIQLLADAGLNAYRFSIEWARIEPEKGKFEESEIAHYRDVIRCCKEHGVEPVVTLLHFTSPKWLIDEGGWEAEETVGRFRDYCAYVIERLGSELHYVCTINEANMGLQIAAISERFKKQMMAAAARQQEVSTSDQEGTVQAGLNLETMMAKQKEIAAENVEVFGTPTPQTFVSARTPEGDVLVMKAHQAARDAIKAKCPHIKVGLTLSLHDVQSIPGGEALAAKEWDEEFSHYLPYIKDDDFLGVQNYTRSVYGPDGIEAVPEGAETTQMDYEFYPEGLANVLRRVHTEFPGDLLITENGIATADDTRREAYIKAALSGVSDCIGEGIPVKGYLHWSLLDNFEWQKGYSMTFGLIAVNRATQERNVKPSLALLGSYAKINEKH